MILYYFGFCRVSIFRKINAKNSKFEGEDKSNGFPLLPHGFFFFFHNIFHMNIHNDSLIFFLCPVSISRIMNAKKNLEIREGTHLQCKPTSTPWIFFFLSREVSYIHSERFLTFFFHGMFVFPEQ